MGIRKLNIQNLESFKIRTFWRSVYRWFGFQTVGTKVKTIWKRTIQKPDCLVSLYHFILVRTEPHKKVAIFFYHMKTELFAPILNAIHNLKYLWPLEYQTCSIFRPPLYCPMDCFVIMSLIVRLKLWQKNERRKKWTPKEIRLWISKKATPPPSLCMT